MTGARRAIWYFDFISPFAYLQWRRFAALRERVALEPRPVLFAALLDHFGQKGPAEIAHKRIFSYQFVDWQARRLGIPFRFPPAHPFNPLAALRLSLALGNSEAVIDGLFEQIWGRGEAGDTPESLAPLASRLGLRDIAAATGASEVKAALRANTEAAIRAGVFGVPTAVVDGHAFWGQDATPMLVDYLDGKLSFDEGEMRRLRDLPSAATRMMG